jgi:CheY-like chemotaxis protein
VKILVVDDAPEIVDSVRLGFAVQWREVDLLAAGTGQQALELVERESPDLVLLDVGLPDIDGFKVLQEIRFFSDVPVVMLTARDDTIDKVKALSSGRTTTSPSHSTIWSCWRASRPFCADWICQHRKAAHLRSSPAKWRWTLTRRSCA